MATDLVVVVSCVHVCSKCLEHRHGPMVATTRGAVEWCPAVVVLRVDARRVWFMHVRGGVIWANDQHTMLATDVQVPVLSSMPTNKRVVVPTLGRDGICTAAHPSHHEY